MTKSAKQTKKLGLYSTPLAAPKNGILEDDLEAVPIATSAFILREDGTIETLGDAPLVEQQKASPPSPPRLAYHDDRGVWLYHGNSLELLDAIAAKYPEGRFDCIFADPPYFLSNGGITCMRVKW